MKKTKTSKYTHRFLASSVIVLNLNHEPDSSGEIIPPEASALISNPIPVLFEFDPASAVGEAYLMRVGNKIIADMHLYSSDKDGVRALDIIKTLYPAIGYQKLQCYENITTHLEVMCVSLGRHGNQDKSIQPLGQRVQPYTRKDELH